MPAANQQQTFHEVRRHRAKRWTRRDRRHEWFATALAGGARWVVTGNTRHLTPLDGYAGLRIAVPAVFLAELDAQG